VIPVPVFDVMNFAPGGRPIAAADETAAIPNGDQQSLARVVQSVSSTQVE
jgi:hypothetical protein